MLYLKRNTIKNKLFWTLMLAVAGATLPAISMAQGVTIDETSATSQNLKVVFNVTDPERIDAIYWNPAGLTGSESNLTRSATFSGDPCVNGLLEYFGNSWAPPDPNLGGKVLVGAGTTGARMKGPDSKVVINSTSTGCVPSANVGVTTLYKFWPGGVAQNKMRVTRTLSFETAFDRDVRPYIPRLYTITQFGQVIYPNAAGTALVTRNVGGGTCPLGCEFTDWNASSEETAWFAIHDVGLGRGLVVKHNPTAAPASLWVDWDGASFTNSSSVLLKKPAGGFTGEIVETQTFCFYDSSTWTPSLTLPSGC